MRVMVIVKATADSEAGALPSAQLMADMGAFNQKLIEAGIMLDGGGRQALRAKARASRFPARTDGDAGSVRQCRELVSGYWIWKVKDLAEAIDWVKRCPNPMPGPSDIEIRELYEMEDFA